MSLDHGHRPHRLRRLLRTAPGPIVFAGHPGDELGGGFNNLMVMNPDGRGVRRLTRTDGDVAPSWSPDGTRVVFERATHIEGCDIDACAQIWIVEADGSKERRLTRASARSEAPDWSPDGDRIVFQPVGRVLNRPLRDERGRLRPQEIDR